MSKDEIKTEKPDKILEIVKEILDFNKIIWKQPDSGLKILTPNQMLCRLPTSLAQLKAGNNSEKLKNEITQIWYILFFRNDSLMLTRAFSHRSYISEKIIYQKFISKIIFT